MTTTHGAERHTTARLGLAFALLAALLASMFSLGMAQAAVPVPSVQPYAQNFDSLISTGSGTWANNATINGWYAAADTLAITQITAYDNTNTKPASGLYSFGATGSSERALGFIGGSPYTPKRLGVVLKNTSKVPIQNFKISYTGEQWFDGSALPETLQFKYKRGASLNATDIITSTGFTRYTALNFTSPQHNAQGPIDGNNAANRTPLTSMLKLSPSLAPNEEIMFIWEIGNVQGQDHGLAIDDLSIQAGITLALPQPTCPSSVTVFNGSATSADLSAYDPNDTVTSATIASVTPNISGISIVNEQPAPSIGGVYMASLQVDGTQPVGNYNVVIGFKSQETDEVSQCTVAVHVQNAPTDLAVSKDGPATYRPDENVSYVITVNPGNTTAANVILTDTLPISVTYVSGNISDNSGVTPTQNGRSVVWNLGDLATQKSIRVVAHVDAGVTGTLVNSVAASTASPDPDQTNNTASATSAFLVLPANFVGSSKTVSDEVVQVGNVFTYTLTISNSGEIGSSYALTDTLPANLSVVSAPGLTKNGQQLTASGPIPANAQLVYNVRVQANATGTVTNTATLSGDGTDRDLIAPAVTILGQATPANFSGSSKMVEASTASPGDELVYTIIVSNSGQLSGNYTLTDNVPVGLRIKEASGMTINGQTLTAKGTLKGGESDEYDVTVEVMANVANTVVNQATLTGDGQTRTLTAQTVTISNRKLYLPILVK